MTLPTDYVDGDVLTAADVNAITLAVNSNTNTKIGAGTFNAKGDLLVGLTNDSVGVLSVGTNGFLLSASSGATAGVAWVPSGGKVLQFASDIVSGFQTTNSTTGADISGLSISFTPVSASSNLLIELSGAGSAYITGASGERVALFQTSAGGIGSVGQYLTPDPTASDAFTAPVCVRVVVASGSTSARTYTGRFQVLTAGTTAQIQDATLTVTEFAP